MSNEQARHATVLNDATRHVARVYAEALYNAADKNGQMREVLEELEELAGDVFRLDPRLEVFLSSPAVARERKEQALRKGFQGRVTPTTLHFLLVLNHHDRLAMLRAVALSYRELYDERSGHIKVQVRSAVPLTEDQAERLRQQLRDSFQREPIMETRVDPDLLGGLVVRVEDWVYDASVRTRLEKIRNQLIERSSHEVQSFRNRFSD